MRTKQLDLLSPTIGFPLLYFAFLLLGYNDPKGNTILITVLFFLCYFTGIGIVNLADRKNYRICISDNIRLRTFNQRAKKFFGVSKWAIIIYYTLILVLFLKIGIADIETFRFNFSSNVLGGGFILLPLNIFLAFNIFYTTILYLNKQLSPSKFLVYSLLNLFFLSLLGSRTNLSVFFFIVGSAFYCERKIPNKKVLLFGFATLILFVSVRVITVLYGDPSRLNFYTNSEILIENNIMQTFFNFIKIQFQDIGYRTQTILEKIPEHFEHTYGKSLFFHFYSVMPGEQINPTIELNHIVFQGSDNEVGYPPTLMSQFYLDFDIWGVLGGGLCFGFVYKRLYNLYKKSSRYSDLFFYILFSFFSFLSIYGEFMLFEVVIFYFLLKTLKF